MEVRKVPMLRVKRSGLTLIEVLLIITFLGIAFFPILEMFSRGFLISSESEADLKATSLVQRLMEEQKGLSFSALQSQPKAQVPGNPDYSQEVIVTEPAVNLRQVETIVYYQVGPSELNISLKTLVANL